MRARPRSCAFAPRKCADRCGPDPASPLHHGSPVRALLLVFAACAVAGREAPREASTPDERTVFGTLALDAVPGSGVDLVAAGRGCADRFCIWLQGFNLS